MAPALSARYPTASTGARGSLQLVPSYRPVPFDQSDHSVVCIGKVSCAPVCTLLVPNNPWQACGRVGFALSLVALSLVILTSLVIKSWHLDITADGVVITRVQSGDLSAHGAGDSSSSSVASPQDFSTTQEASYTFVHDGHCALGYTGKSQQPSIEGCSAKCLNEEQCGYFAYSFGLQNDPQNCALYTAEGGCPDDDSYPDHNSYRIHRQASVVTVAAETSTSTLSVRGGPLETVDAIAVEASTTSVMIFKEDSATATTMTTTTATSLSHSPTSSAASIFTDSLPPMTSTTRVQGFAPTPAQLPETTAKPSFQMVMPTTAYPHAPQPVEWLTEGVTYVERSKSPTLFCWAIVLTDSAEKWLMITQLHRGTGIFGCHKYTLFSDSDFFMGEGPWGWGAVNATPIPGKPAWKGPVPGSGQMVWHNTGVFVRAYKRIQSDGFFNAYDWSVKVDPDTAFIPGVLQQKLAGRNIDPSIPVYFVNCQTWHSLQGPLEVLSRQAGKLLYGQYQKCLDGLPWEDWGEDWFINKCLDMLGVQGWDGFDMLNDAWCQDTYQNTGHDYWEEVEQNGPTCDDGKPAHHPYKTTKDMIACLDQAEPLHRVRVKVPVPEDLHLIP